MNLIYFNALKKVFGPFKQNWIEFDCTVNDLSLQTNAVIPNLFEPRHIFYITKTPMVYHQTKITHNILTLCDLGLFS